MLTWTLLCDQMYTSVNVNDDPRKSCAEFSSGATSWGKGAGRLAASRSCRARLASVALGRELRLCSPFGSSTAQTYQQQCRGEQHHVQHVGLPAVKEALF